MDKKERVFAVSQEGIYNQTSRPSSHHSIITAKTKMVRLSYIRCNELYKGQSHFKNAEDEEFYNRNKSTPAKILTTSYYSGGSTTLANSFHSRDNSLEIQKRGIDTLDRSSHQTGRHSRNYSGNLPTKYIFEETHKFELPKNFEQNSQNITSTSPDPIPRDKRSIMTRVQECLQKTGDLVADHTRILVTPSKNLNKNEKVSETPNTHYETPSSKNNAVQKLPQNLSSSHCAESANNLFKKQPIFYTPNAQFPCYLSTQKNKKIQQLSSNVTKRILYTPESNKGCRSEESPSIVVRTYSPSITRTQNPSLSQESQIKNPEKFNSQNKNNQEGKPASYQRSLQEEIFELKKQLRQKQSEVWDYRSKLSQSQHREKIMKSEIDKLRTSGSDNTIRLKAYVSNSSSYQIGQRVSYRQRDWSAQLRRELEKEGNEKSALFLLTLFMVLLCKQTLA